MDKADLEQVFAVIFARWLVGKGGKQGELMTIEQVGEALGSKSFHQYMPDFILFKAQRR